MRLNLGCGGDRKPDFINIDIAGGDALCDLRDGIPPNVASADSVDYIYTSHFLEHIYDDQVSKLLKSCHDVMRRSGRIRICLPDFRKLINAYVTGDLEFFSLLPVGDSKNPISFLEYCAYQYNGRENDHKALYDFHKVRKMLSDAGFVNIKESQFDPSIDVDTEDRKRYSLYVDAQKKLLYPTYMNGKNVLFAITCFDRLQELRLQETLIRNEFGKTVGLHVFCNAPEEDSGKYQNLLEDGFHWMPNTGHSQGSIDHTNMVVDVAAAYDYVVLLAAKTIFTDYSVISSVVDEMIENGKEIAVFDDKGIGHFRDPMNYGFFCDFMVFSSALYNQVFPVKLEPEEFPEIVITNKVLELVRKDDIYYIACDVPGNPCSDFIFRNILGTKHDAISIRDIESKIKYLESKNSRYKSIFENLLRQT